MAITTTDIKARKASGKKITMLTAYDYFLAAMVDEAGVDMILIGDSLGMTQLGYENTLAVTLEDILHHTKAVTRAVKNSLVVADLPFLTYHITVEEAVRNAGRCIQEGGARAVKIEGGEERGATVRAIVDAQIPVVAHIGLTPQSVHQMGGFKVQGKDLETARKLIRDAQAMEAAGAFCIVLEGVPSKLACEITKTLTIPTIGIGAGVDCDGQVLVINDVLGMFKGHSPKFAKKFADLEPLIAAAIKEYKTEVESGAFPTPAHSFTIRDDVLEKLY